MEEYIRSGRKLDPMGNQEVATCFECPEFDSHKGCCKRANQLKPCIRLKNDVSTM